MNLHVKYDVNVEVYDEFRDNLDDQHREILDRVVNLHFEEGEGDWKQTDLPIIVEYYLEEIYPNDLVYCEYTQDDYIKGWVFELPREILETVRTSLELPREILETVRTSLELPREDLPAEINTKNPLTKMIIDWRLKNG